MLDGGFIFYFEKIGKCIFVMKIEAKKKKKN